MVCEEWCKGREIWNLPEFELARMSSPVSTVYTLAMLATPGRAGISLSDFSSPGEDEVVKVRYFADWWEHVSPLDGRTGQRSSVLGCLEVLCS